MKCRYSSFEYTLSFCPAQAGTCSVRDISTDGMKDCFCSQTCDLETCQGCFSCCRISTSLPHLDVTFHPSAVTPVTALTVDAIGAGRSVRPVTWPGCTTWPFSERWREVSSSSVRDNANDIEFVHSKQVSMLAPCVGILEV